MKVLGRKFFIKLFLIALFFIFGFEAYRFVHKTQYFPVKYVSVYGAKHVDHQEVQNFLMPLVSHNFFAVDMDLIQDKLRQFSWVEDIAIRRVWPDRVEIHISEHQPVAFWHDGSLLSANGDLFKQGDYEGPSGLAKFEGPDGSQRTMLEYFNDFNRELSPLHVKITQLELTSYQMWRLTLNNGVRLRLGHKNILTRLSQFVKVYPKIIGDKAEEVDYVDLRYPNGMALKWKNAG